MENIKSVIFDMYETLFPNAPESWEEVFRDIVKTQDLAVSSRDLWLIWREKIILVNETFYMSYF